MNVTLKQMRAFVALAEAGSFTAAARQLHVTPSALSLVIKDLESGVGMRLFDRTTRETRLSPGGREFLPAARKLVEDFGRALEGLREFKASERGVLRIAGSPIYSGTLVPQLAAEYGQQFPGVRVHVIDALTDQVAAKVANGDADLGIAPERPVPAEVRQTQLFRDPVQLVCPPQHPLASRDTVEWVDVIRHPFISLSPDYTMGLRADLAHHSESLTLEPAAYVTFITTALALVKWGRGVTAQPSHADLLAAAYGLVVRPIQGPRIERRICLLAPREREHSPAALSFHEFLARRFQLEPQRQRPDEAAG
ncbi:LysR family transcriptional regulator [Ramlibacter henchirensis]|uniref:LysR family transcriptional regulator n=1 Tax=Ramlibacter henchirensis TaxID=204072 RepID=A0A4Z0BX41_9BURK|nr:LysR family transcriptional regulator [Ramlibacter henchirensis]TFZ02549.1 LysR family transcriptional regulator [Ramlibacter henchirensis]